MAFLLLLITAASAFDFSATLDASTAHHTFAGHGALSAGASSRLLWDYSEPQRTQILDYLFKPQFGAGIQILKVEIGGDAQSTDGTEPSHKHTRSDLSCSRGYELFLIKEAKARNPNIITYGLSWGLPAWVGNNTYYSTDNIFYQTQWVDCINKEAGVVVDYLGLWNEKPQGDADYVLSLRASLDAGGFSATKLVVMDGQFDGSEVALAQSNASYREAVYGAGLHYPCNQPHPNVEGVGWDFWASEDYSRDPAWDNGGSYWGKVLSENYILNNMTATISWSLIWSAYTNLVCNGAGLMRAHTPWSGWYEVSSPMWMTAHWTQFVTPGWRFLLPMEEGGSGWLTPSPNSTPSTTKPSGTYVTLVPPKSSPTPGVTLIVETLVNDACIPRAYYADINATFKLAMPLPSPTLQVWRTTRDAYFVRLPDVTVDSRDNSFTVSIPQDSITTFSSVTGATKGGFPGSPIPPPAPWALPYREDFSGYAQDAMARFWSDQGGSWAVRDGGLVMTGEADPGANGWSPNPDPLTQLGDETWQDYAVSVVVAFNTTGPYPATTTTTTPPVVQHQRQRQRTPAPPHPTSAREAAWRAGKGLPALGSPSLPTQQHLGGGGAGVQAGGSSSSSAWTLTLAPCDPTDTAQGFTFDTPAQGYLRNAAQGRCVDVNGCGSVVDLYTCVDDPAGSSCGAPNGQYPNLVWAWDAGSGAVTSGIKPGPLVLSAFPGNASTYALPMGTPGMLQAWDYNASSGALGVRGSTPPLCLSSPPLQKYARVCARVTHFDGFSGAPIAATCLWVFHTGAWELVSPSDTSMGSGSLPTPFDPATPHTLKLAMVGTSVQAWVDGVSIIALDSAAVNAPGNVAIGTGWHGSRWDDFVVEAA